MLHITITKKNTNQGITLIALVITIIVLLILAGISIVALTGQNGVMTKASTAKEESKKAEYKEVLELIGNGIKPEKLIEQITTKIFMDRYQEKLEEKAKEGECLEGCNVERITSNIIRVTTEEGYVYSVTENEVKYLQYGENMPPDLQETDIEFVLDPERYTNQTITVEIKPKIDIEGYILQYSTDGSIWNNYTEKVIFEENGFIYARLVNVIGEIGGVASKEIDKIERELPNEAIITFDKTVESVGESITATVTQIDEQSGVDIENCKYILTATNTPLETSDVSKYTKEFTTAIEDKITLRYENDYTNAGNYYLHVLTVDKAGNKKETISEKIRFYQTTYYLQGSNTYNSITGGYTSASYAAGSGTNYFYYGSTQGQWAKGNYCVGAMYNGSKTAASTIKKVDLTGIDTLYCDWILYSDAGPAVENMYYFGVTSNPCDTSTSFNKVYKVKKTNENLNQFSTVSIDVSDLSGSYYIKVMCERVKVNEALWMTCYLGFKNIYGR